MLSLPTTAAKYSDEYRIAASTPAINTSGVRIQVRIARACIADLSNRVITSGYGVKMSNRRQALSADDDDVPAGPQSLTESTPRVAVMRRDIAGERPLNAHRDLHHKPPTHRYCPSGRMTRHLNYVNFAAIIQYFSPLGNILIN